MKPAEILIGLAILLALIAIQTSLIMVIFNKVIIPKFPSSDIKTLSFWDALAISVLVALLNPHIIAYVSK